MNEIQVKEVNPGSIEQDMNQTDFIKVEPNMELSDFLDDRYINVSSTSTQKIESQPTVVKEERSYVKSQLNSLKYVEVGLLNSGIIEKMFDGPPKEIWMIHEEKFGSQGKQMRIKDAPTNCLIRCRQCGNNYVGLRRLEFHSQQAHSHHCLYCGTVYQSSPYSVPHERSCSVRANSVLSVVGTLKEIECKDCGINFKNQSYYEWHKNSRREYVCQVCDTKFPFQCSYLVHLKVHYTPFIEELILLKEVSAKCRTSIHCGGERCANIDPFGHDFVKFLGHVTLDHEVGNCVICKLEFNNSQHRMEHVLKTHPRHCYGCWKIFKSPQSAMIHFSRAHFSKGHKYHETDKRKTSEEIKVCKRVQNTKSGFKIVSKKVLKSIVQSTDGFQQITDFGSNHLNTNVLLRTEVFVKDEVDSLDSMIRTRNDTDAESNEVSDYEVDPLAL